ncbi:DUF3466 family protein [Thalassotalea psychrophila]|uniref:DUF3466 family protein n=1 Tax=Thalassotalea psychrophila TaxID=3065647 RepID=A0ABY9TNW2_9GAMM|nr:DUF3466 family protein [Colwelliaceae bacterium SQ149]
MKTLIKSVLALSITGALIAPTAHAVTYTIEDLGIVTPVENTYGIEQNNNGQVLLSGQTTYNFPVQFQYFDEDGDDFDEIIRLANNTHDQFYDLFRIDDEAEDALRAGNPDANALSWTIRWLRGKGSTFYQKYGDAQVYIFEPNTASATELPIFDVAFEDAFEGNESLTRSTIDVAKGITDEGLVFGHSSAPFLPLPPFDDGGSELEVHWVNEFTSRGWIKSVDGSINFELTPFTELDPETNHYGGLSAVNDIASINGNTIAIGTSSVGLNPNAVEDLEEEGDYCDDREDDLPFEACVQIIRANLYYSNAFKWEVDPTGTIVTTTDLGRGVINIHEDDKRPFTSAAVSVNDSGIIVGYSHFWWDEDETTPSRGESVGSFAAIFKDDEIIDFTDRDDYFESRALDINNNGIFTGYMYTYVNGKARTKFYYANANEAEITPVFPIDFFKGSSSYPHGINNNGMIVGEGEVEDFVDSPSTPRRRHGFLYSINDDAFYNVNQFLSCEDQEKYVIVEARDVNEENVILGTAWVKAPKLDSKGEPFSIDGEVIPDAEQDVLVAVKLTPTGEEFQINDCSEELGEKTERRGASLGFLSILAGMSLWFRRRKFNH